MGQACLPASGRLVDRIHLDVARGFGAGWLDTWLTVVLPSLAFRWRTWAGAARQAVIGR